VILLYCFDTVLRLLHPVVPFITEELWQKLPGRRPDELLAGAAWPEPKPALESADAALQFERVKQAIERIRSIRAEYRIAPKERIRATIVARGTDRRETFEGERETITRLAQLSELSFNGDRVAKPGAHAVFGDGSEILVPLEGALIEKECRRLSEELARIDRQIQAQAAKLGNESFLSRAPADVVQREREKEREWHQQRSTLVTKLESLGCS
jgi:valyl-tRNA synthetase